jgi:hypothetical protein
VLLVPSITERDGVAALAFDPEVEALDLQSLPGFVDQRITEAINEGFDAHKHKLAWAFARTLSVNVPLPQRVSPSGRFSLVAEHGAVEVTADALRLTIGFAAHVTHEPAIVTTHPVRDREVASAAGSRAGGHRRMPRQSPSPRREPA